MVDKDSIILFSLNSSDLETAVMEEILEMRQELFKLMVLLRTLTHSLPGDFTERCPKMITVTVRNHECLTLIKVTEKNNECVTLIIMTVTNHQCSIINALIIVTYHE